LIWKQYQSGNTNKITNFEGGIIVSLTTPEVMFIQEHLRSCNSTIGFLQFAAANCQNHQLKSLCQQMAQDHISMGNRFAGVLNRNVQ
jgi:hypothetical protein